MADTKRKVRQAATEYTTPFWFVEVWQELRPLVIKLLADFAIFIAIWILLLGAHALTARLPLMTSLSWVVVAFHEVIVVATFMWLSVTAAWDIMLLRRRRARHVARHRRSRS